MHVRCTRDRLPKQCEDLDLAKKSPAAGESARSTRTRGIRVKTFEDYSRVSSLSVTPVKVTKRITPLVSSKTSPVEPWLTTALTR